MSDPTSLLSRRWKRDENPNSYKPRDVLVETLRQIDAGELDAEHIVVIHARHTKPGSAGFTVGYCQGGAYDIMQTVGFVTRGLHMLDEDG